MDDFEKELKVSFLDEASQALSEVEQCFLSLESDPDNLDNLNRIFRLAHNLKGSSKAVGFIQMGEFTHEFETFILKIKNKEITCSPEAVSFLLVCNDQLLSMVNGLKENLEALFDSTALMNQMRSWNDSAAVVAESYQAPEVLDPVPETELDDIEKLLQANAQQMSVVPAPVQIEEPKVPESTKVPESKKAPELSKAAAVPDDSIRISLSKVENLINYVGEMVILQSVISQQVSETELHQLKKTVIQISKISKEIQDISMSLRLVPIKSVFQKMQRIVRDTAQALQKDVGITLIGEDTELDKTIIERIGDPLVHLVRNSVDHGVEMPTVRLAKNKSAKGQVTLKAAHESGKLVIEVKDDGGGLDPQKLIKKAIEKGILKPGAQLSDQAAYDLIFAPGFSTKELVTDVSGRGVGMDVVKTNVKDLSGEIQIDSILGQGTTFKITLPLTLSIIEAMIVEACGAKYVMPLNHIHETLRPKPEQIQISSNLGEILILRGENLPCYRLADFFGQRPSRSTREMIALVVRTGPKPWALIVDDILRQQQVVTKPLGPELKGLVGISGSTILGDGCPCLILEPKELLKRKVSRTIGQPMAEPTAKKQVAV